MAWHAGGLVGGGDRLEAAGEQNGRAPANRESGAATAAAVFALGIEELKMKCGLETTPLLSECFKDNARSVELSGRRKDYFGSR